MKNISLGIFFGLCGLFFALDESWAYVAATTCPEFYTEYPIPHIGAIGNYGTSSEKFSNDGGGTWNLYVNERIGTPPTGSFYGIASCNTTDGTTVGSVSDTEFENTVTGKFCWCKATGFSGSTYLMIPGDTNPISNIKFSAELTSKWVFAHKYDIVDGGITGLGCSNKCPEKCRELMAGDSSFNNAVYNAVQTKMCVLENCPSGYVYHEDVDTCIQGCPNGQANQPMSTPSVNPASTGTSGSAWNATWTSGDMIGVATGVATCAEPGLVDPVIVPQYGYKPSGWDDVYNNACWCKLTSWNGIETVGSLYTLVRRYYHGYDCSSGCLSACANAMNDATTRAKVFDATACSTCPVGYAVSAGPDNTTVCSFSECPIGYTESTENDVKKCTFSGCPTGYVEGFDSAGNKTCTLGDCPIGYFKSVDDNNNDTCVFGGCPIGYTETTQNSTQVCIFSGCPYGYVQEAGNNGTTICTFSECSVGMYETSVSLQKPTTVPTDQQYGTYSGDQNPDGDLDAMGWKLTWTTGDVLGTAKGTSKCGSYPGIDTNADGGTIAPGELSSGSDCYCKLTQWNGVDVTAKWVKNSLSGGITCVALCASLCAGSISGTALNPTGGAVREAIFRQSVLGCTMCPDANNFYTNNALTIIPSVSNSSISSPVQSTAITQCYAKKATSFYNEKGRFKFPDDCYYTE